MAPLCRALPCAGLQIGRQRIDLMHSLNQMLSRLVGIRIADSQRD